MNMKKRYWRTNGGLLMVTNGMILPSNAEEISKSKYYKLLKENKRIGEDLEENGIAIGDDGTLYLNF